MKKIKYFEYWYTYEFEIFLKDYGYTLEDVKGFSFAGKRQCQGNVIKLYNVRFNDGEYEYFKIVYFKSFNECNSARLGFKGDKLLSWYNDANVRKYKLNNEYIYE